MIEVHIWKPNTKRVGHTSATIKSKNSSDLAYVSWWPEMGIKNPFKPVDGKSNDFQSDVEAEEGYPDFNLKFNKLNEEKAIEWWRWYTNHSNHNYNLSSTNCSWAVIKALKAGGSDDFFFWVRFFSKTNFNLPMINVQDTLYKFIVEAYNAYEKEGLSKGKLKLSAVNLVDKFSSTWSPLDVNKYCSILTNAIEGKDSFTVTFKINLLLTFEIGVDLINNKIVSHITDLNGNKHELKPGSNILT